MTLALDDEHRRIVREILAAHLPGDVRVLAFGSRVKNSHRPLSDLDLALEGHASLTLAERADLSDAFSESDLPFKVDVVDLTTSDAAFRAIVEREGVEF